MTALFGNTLIDQSRSSQVTVNNDLSDESFESAWSYMQHKQSNALFVHDRVTFHKEVSQSQVTSCLQPAQLSGHVGRLFLYDAAKVNGFISSRVVLRLLPPGTSIYCPEEHSEAGSVPEQRTSVLDSDRRLLEGPVITSAHLRLLSLPPVDSDLRYALPC